MPSLRVMKPHTLILSIALVGSLLAGCGEPAGRTGSGTDPVSLTAYEAGPDEFLGRLATGTVKSAVAIATVPNPNANGDGDTAGLAALASGDLDLALIRSGRLTKEGAASLAPLGAPFLVTNNDQAIAIARDPVTEDLFADLPKIGLVGLGLVPMGVRHPFGYGEPLLGAGDYADQTINGRVDAGVKAILDALGARLDTSGRRGTHREGGVRRAARDREFVAELRCRGPACCGHQQREPLRALRRRGGPRGGLGRADDRPAGPVAFRGREGTRCGLQRLAGKRRCSSSGAGSLEPARRRPARNSSRPCTPLWIRSPRPWRPSTAR